MRARKGQRADWLRETDLHEAKRAGGRTDELHAPFVLPNKVSMILKLNDTQQRFDKASNSLHDTSRRSRGDDAIES